MADGKKMTLKLTDLVLDPRLQMRKKGTDADHARDLAADLKKGETLPRPRVWETPDGYYVSDGFSTTTAYQILKRTEIDCDVQKGTFEDAFLDACKANSQHKALKLTPQDRENAVRKLMKFIEAKGEIMWGQARIAEACNVSPALVKKVKDDITANANTSSERVGQKQNVADKTVGKDGRLRGKRHEAAKATEKAPRGPISLESTDWRSLPLSDFWTSIAVVEKAVEAAGIECLGDLFDALNSDEGVKGVGPFQAAVEIEKIGKVEGFDGKIAGKKKLVNGALAFDWDGLLETRRKLTRQIDDAAHSYKSRGTLEYKGLDQMMRDLESALKAAKVAWKKLQTVAA